MKDTEVGDFGNRVILKLFRNEQLALKFADDVAPFSKNSHI